MFQVSIKPSSLFSFLLLSHLKRKIRWYEWSYKPYTNTILTRLWSHPNDLQAIWSHSMNVWIFFFFLNGFLCESCFRSLLSFNFPVKTITFPQPAFASFSFDKIMDSQHRSGTNNICTILRVHFINNIYVLKILKDALVLHFLLLVY